MGQRCVRRPSSLLCGCLVLTLPGLHRQEYKWKGYEAPHNVFDDGEVYIRLACNLACHQTARVADSCRPQEYKAPAWKTQETPHNVFDDMEAEEAPKWKTMEPEANALAEVPDVYPFDETKDGHEWKKWDKGETASDMIKEHNVFDDGTTTSMAYQVAPPAHSTHATLAHNPPCGIDFVWPA